MLLAGTFAAQAYLSNDTYYDLVGPNGQPRDDATFDADLNFCYGQTGVSHYRQDTGIQAMHARPQMALGVGTHYAEPIPTTT